MAEAPLNRFIPHLPHPQQHYFLSTHNNYRYREALFGGSAGGGKTICLLMAALQYVEHPNYHALLLRKTFRDLSQPGALIPLSLEWLTNKADWNAQAKRWTFPSGATLTFGYLDSSGDAYQYQGANFSMVGWDELTQMRESDYRYLFSRLRKRVEDNFPLRIRATSNPGGIGHEWVKKRFLIENHPDRLFVPSLLQDNPSLDAEDYRQSLAHLDPITRAQLLEGDWDAYQGGRFLPSWFAGKTYTTKDGRYWPRGRAPDGWHRNSSQVFVIVDLAASEKQSADYTVFGCFLLTPEQDLLVLDIRRERFAVDRIVPELQRFCEQHKPGWVGIENNGFQVAIVSQAQRTPGMPPVRGLATGGKSKLVRATPAIVRAEAGQIFLPVSAPWLEDFLAELTQFTGDDKKDAHDDAVDVLAFAVLSLQGGFVAPTQPASPPPDPKRIYERPAPGRSPTDRLFGRRR